MFTGMRRSVVLALMLLAATLGSPSAQATLLGDTITGSGDSLTPATATIGAGVEFTGIFGYLDFDFGASTLTLTSNANVNWYFFGNYVFSGFDSIITGLSIESNSGFGGDLVNGAFSFTANSITLGLLDGFATSEDAVLVFGIQTQTVPEPATLALLGLGLAGLGLRRRKRS